MSLAAAHGPSRAPHSPQVVDQPVRCPECSKLLMELASRPWRATCPRCHCQAEATKEGIAVLKHGNRH